MSPCPANPSTMPPRPSHSREKEPRYDPSPQDQYSNRQSPPLSRGEPSRNFRHQTRAKFTPQPKQKNPALSTSVVYGEPTTSTNGSSSISDNILKTPQGQLPGPVLRGDRSPNSTPTSPNYFELLYEEEEDPTSPSLPLQAKQAKTRKRVTFATIPPPQIIGPVPSTGRNEREMLLKAPLQLQRTW